MQGKILIAQLITAYLVDVVFEVVLAAYSIDQLVAAWMQKKRIVYTLEETEEWLLGS